MENNRAAVRMLHQNDVPYATPIPPLVAPAPYNPGPFVPRIFNGDLEEIGSEVMPDEDEGPIDES